MTTGFGSAFSGFAHPKGPARKDDRAERQAVLSRLDKIEHAIVRARSGGRCELRVAGERCKRRAVHDHHRFGGIGRRNRTNESLHANNRAALCADCHSDVHLHRLRPATWDEKNWAASVQWERLA